jgi:nitrate/nitrite transporter NarK
VADRFSVKLLLALSLIGTGIGGFIHLLPLGFTSLSILYAFWGFTSLFAFWPASVKAIRMMAESGDQGKAYGIFEGARGVFAAATAMAAVFFYALGDNAFGEAAGLRNLLFYYGIGTIVTGILVLLFFRENKTLAPEGEDSKIHLRDVGAVLKIPATWIIAIVTLCGYVFTMSISYLTPYSTEFFGISVTMAAGISAAKRFVSPVATGGGGFLIDRIGTAPLFLTSFLVMAAMVTIMLAIPAGANMLVLFIVLYMVCYFFYCVNYGLTWSMMDEGKIPLRLSGTAAGVIATIGYLPEAFCPPIAGITLDTHEGKSGYVLYFSFVIVMLLVGAIFVLIWRRYLKIIRAREAAETPATPERG